MVINVRPEQEARLAALAAREGSNVDELAQEAITRLLDEDVRFTDAVKLGLASADRGDFVASEEVWAGVERILMRVRWTTLLAKSARRIFSLPPWLQSDVRPSQ